MKIVNIFADKLFAFHYDDEKEDELKRLLNLWNDPNYLFHFVSDNIADVPKGKSTGEIVSEIIESSNHIDDTLYELTNDDTKNLDQFFKPLNNQEYKIVQFSRQKGRDNFLRIYAVKIDSNCYVITGGAIKFTRFMKDRPHTERELTKIERCRDFLRSSGILDSDVLYEFLNESL